MDNFADYILNEKDYIKKLEILYYFQRKTGVFFDNSVILKAELVKMFIEVMNLQVDKNLVITACLLCACKKKKDATDIETIKNYAQDGAKYLITLGFDKRFCKICEEVNRYSGSAPRETESDVLELVDIFGGLVLDRPERRGFPIDEALVLTEYRNLKGVTNIFLEEFKSFVYIEENIKEGMALMQREDFTGRIAKIINLANEQTTDAKDMMSVLVKENISEYLKSKSAKKVEEHTTMLNQFQS